MRKFLHRVLLAANIFFVAALLFSYLSVHISPEKFALPALFGLAYPYLLLINILFSLCWIIFLKFESLISIAAIALGITHLSNYIRIGKPESSKENTFKVMSYNVRLFNSYEKTNGGSSRRIEAFLKSEKPDIVCLQEFYIEGNPIQKDQAFRAATGIKYHSHQKMIGSGKNRYYGIVTYSRFPIINKGQIVHPGSSSLSIFTDIVIEKDTFRIFNNHLQSFRLRKMERSFLEEITDPDDKETFKTMKLLTISLRRAFIRRAHQADEVKRNIEKSPYPVIVTGDFNDTPVSYSYRKIRKGLNDSFISSGYGAGFTNKGNYPANRIDYILFNNELECASFEILKVKYSDHYPVVSWFRKAGQKGDS